MNRSDKAFNARARCAALGLLAVLLAAPAAAEGRRSPGYVDGDVFLDLVGDQNVKIEVSISKSLINIITSAHDQLKALAGGLESINAIVADLGPGTEQKALDAIRAIDRRLAKDGWERVARVRDEGTDIKVLVLNDGKAIEGLVVMMVEREERELIFVNIAGRMDPRAIQMLSEGFDIPGLEGLDVKVDE